MSLNSLKLILLVFLSALIASCSSSEPFTGFSYDPEGATETTDKPITPQHKRTIGITADGVWISNEFEGARINDFYKVNNTLYRAVIAPENAPINNSPWYAFKAWADTAKEVQIQLTYKNGEHRYIPKLSNDGKHWQRIAPKNYAPDTLSGTARLSLSLNTDTLWISAQELITEDLFNTWADSLSKKSFVEKYTAGYSHQNRPISKLTISEVPSQKPRGVVIITSRLHPPEVTGQLAALKFIEELASQSELAQQFRQHFEIITYPFANPDGVENGHWRHNAGGVDLNRDWVAFHQPETKAIRDDLIKTVKNDSLKKVYYGIDFHSTDENIFYPINKDITTFPDNFTYRWLQALTEAFPNIDFAIEPFDTSSPISKNWIFRTFGADALTYEVNDTMPRTLIDQTATIAAQLMMRMLLDEMKKNNR